MTPRSEILRRFAGGESIVSIAVSLSCERPTSAREVEAVIRCEVRRAMRVLGPLLDEGNARRGSVVVAGERGRR